MCSRGMACMNRSGYLPTSLLLSSATSKGILGGAGEEEEGCRRADVLKECTHL